MFNHDGMPEWAVKFAKALVWLVDMKKCLFCFICGLLFVFGSGNAAHSQSFVIKTIAGSAGNPTGQFSTGDGTNLNARFYSPMAVGLDSATNVYITDGHAVRRLSLFGTNWVVTTLAGNAQTSDPNDVDGTNGVARFRSPSGIAVDASINLYVANTLNSTIRKVTPFGTNWVVTTVAGLAGTDGSTDGTNTDAHFNNPYGIAVDGATNLYVADTYNNTIRKIRPMGTNWVVSTLVGLASTPGTNDGTNTDARFTNPVSIAADTATNLYVADFSNHTIRKVTPSGTNWVVTTVAGLALSPGSTDGTNSNAKFNFPFGVAVDGAGNIFVSEWGNTTIRKIRPFGTNWVVSTLAGAPGMVGSADGIGSAARFNQPAGLGVDGAGNVYIADSLNYTMRLGQLAVLLQIARSANQVVVSWSSAATGFVLETSSVLPANSWTRITNGPVLSGETWSLTTNTTAPAAFFRLHKP